MHQVQDQLQFKVETPSDEEMCKRWAKAFANRQQGVDAIRDQLMDGPQHHQSNTAKRGHKTRNRKSKQQKKQERMNRDKEAC